MKQLQVRIYKTILISDIDYDFVKGQYWNFDHEEQPHNETGYLIHQIAERMKIQNVTNVNGNPLDCRRENIACCIIASGKRVPISPEDYAYLGLFAWEIKDNTICSGVYYMFDLILARMGLRYGRNVKPRDYRRENIVCTQ